jgi:hypothetical protein
VQVRRWPIEAALALRLLLGANGPAHYSPSEPGTPNPLQPRKPLQDGIVRVCARMRISVGDEILLVGATQHRLRSPDPAGRCFGGSSEPLTSRPFSSRAAFGSKTR